MLTKPEAWTPYRVLLPTLAPSLGGFGDASSATAAEAGAISVASSVGALASSGALAAVIAGGSIVPLIGPAIAAVAVAIELILHSGCGITCVETSQWANQAEQLLIQNIQAYFSGPRNASSQAVCLSAFDNIWAGLESRCGQSGTGAAGQRCITDREAGACTWKQTSTSPLLQYPGEPQPGACWNWFNGYRDPIANDPNVIADATPASSTGTVSDSVSSSLSTVATSVSDAVSSLTSNPLLLVVGLGILVLAFAGGSKS